MLDQGRNVESACEAPDLVSTLTCDATRHCCLHTFNVAKVPVHGEDTKNVSVGGGGAG